MRRGSGPGPKDPSLTLPIVVTVLVIVVWALSGVLIYDYAGAERGIFGDMFGAINALFSGLAFAGVLYAIMLQRTDLRLQKHEHELSRAEMAAQREQLIAQNETLRLQSFENTFFQLLRLHNDIVNSIDLVRAGTGVVTARGRDCFRVFYAQFHKRWQEEREDDAAIEELERIRRTYNHFYLAIEAEAGHYFLTLYNLVKFIDDSTVTDKKRYTNLVRAHLSSYEVALLFYSYLSEKGSAKFKPLVERYGLLKMFPRNDLLDTRHLALYAPSAYGSTPGTA